jgi:hypothetical protein
VRSVFSTRSATGDGDAAAVVRREASFRYAAVFLLMVVLLVFVIVAPNADLTRAVVCALQGAALLVVVATSRERRQVRRARVRGIAVVAVLVVAAIALGFVPAAIVALINGALAISVMAALVQGLLRLVRQQGVTAQAVAGALTIYVLTGLVFAWIVSVAADIGTAHYFAGGTDGTQGDRVYYSFTVLTTTGFGDYTAATPVGHALAVVEMLLGQLYLVSVIGVLVGAVAGRSRR